MLVRKYITLNVDFGLDIYRETIYYIGELYIDYLYKEVQDGS